jgi:hypothetical protein
MMSKPAAFWQWSEHRIHLPAGWRINILSKKQITNLVNFWFEIQQKQESTNYSCLRFFVWIKNTSKPCQA